MPLYEYECEACHRRTEKIQKFSSDPLTICPFCGGRLERTITAAAFNFSGGGWYKDGYGSAKPAAADSSTTSAVPAGAAAAGASTPTAAPAATPAAASPAPAASTAAKP